MYVVKKSISAVLIRIFKCNFVWLAQIIQDNYYGYGWERMYVYVYKIFSLKFPSLKAAVLNGTQHKYVSNISKYT
jgi:hypothetical protein